MIMFKHALFIYFLLLFAANIGNLQAQGTTCQTATPFCSNTLDTFSAGVNTPAAPVGNNYDCLGSQPNPAWFTLNISSSGSVSFNLDNTAQEDIDFILWGPFPNQAAINAACGNLGNGGTSGGVVDCSFSGSALETVTIPNAVAGQMYVLLVTNYSNNPTNIFSTANTGSGSTLCNCDLDVTFFETPIPNNQGSLVDTTTTSAEFVVCAPSSVSATPNSLYFTIGIGAQNATDSLDWHIPSTNLAQSFGAGNFAVFTSYPNSSIGRYDSLEITIAITAAYSEIGIHDFNIGVVNYSTNTCIQALPIRVVIPGVEIISNDTTLCPGIQHQIPLTANIRSVQQGGTGTYQWQQITGNPTTLSSATVANPTLTIPATTTNGDVIEYALSYTDTTGCTVSDTITFRMQTRAIQVDLSADQTLLCNTGNAQVVNFLARTDSAGIVPQNGTYTWTPATNLSNTSIANPSASLVGNSPADSVRYVVRFDYGTCSGTDTVMIRFRNTSLTTLPALDTACSGEPIPFSSVLSDTFRTVSFNCNAYTVAPIGFNPLISIASTPITNFSNTIGGAADLDQGTSDPIRLPFTFNYYCQNYDTIYAAVNGFVTFEFPDLFSTGASTIPDATNANNAIAGAWADLDLSFSGSVSYFTAGAAPNRVFVIEYSNVPYFFTSDSVVSFQIHLFEGSNNIEIHTSKVEQDDAFAPFFIGTATQGVENPAGTVGTTVAGRNDQSFTAFNDAFRFSPASTTTVTPVTYLWQPSNTLNNATISNPIATPLVNTTYRVSVTNNGCVYTDTIPVVIRSSIAAPTITCAGATNTSLTFAWTTLTGASAYEYSIDGVNWTSTTTLSTTLTGIASGTSINLQVRGINPGSTCRNGLTGVGRCTTSVCNITPSVVITQATGCDGSVIPSNGRAVVNATPTNPTLVYTLNNGRPAQTSNTFDSLIAGSYIVTISQPGTACTATANFSVTSRVDDVRLSAWIGQQGQKIDSILISETTTINAGNANANATITWAGQGISSPNQNPQTITPTAGGDFVYVVTATAGTNGCIRRDTVRLHVIESGFRGMPTGFTPDGDGQNDVFRPVQLVGVSTGVFRVYNRWGQLLYETQNLSTGGWDGTYNSQMQPRDAYIYHVEFKLPSETTTRQLRGEFTLIR
jgi:gliding motility-associated-like protein